jgi:alkyl hydroperoxide reductase subunit AhpC
MAEQDQASPPLRRQLPPGVSFAAITIAILALFYIVGRSTPTAPQSPYSGRSAEDFTATTTDGGTLRLSDYKGKVVLLNFWATWCGPCKMEIPDLIALQNKYGQKGFAVIGISDDDEAKKVQDFMKSNGINYPVAMATQDIKNQFGGIPALPVSILIDKDGKIVTSMEGIDPSKSVEVMWAAEIEKIL